VSYGILQLAVNGTVPLQLVYTSPRADSQAALSGDDESFNQVNQSIDDEFACILELI